MFWAPGSTTEADAILLGMVVEMGVEVVVEVSVEAEVGVGVVTVSVGKMFNVSSEGALLVVSLSVD